LIKFKDIVKIALLTGAFFVLNTAVFGQKGTLELLPGSDKLGYDEKTGTHRLVGSVNFNYQGNTMYCDSAHYRDKTQEVRAYGNVHIVKDEINLYCDSLYYNGKTRKAKLWGHVRARDREYKLSTDTLDYDAKLSQGVYRHGGKIESITSDEVLTSRVGYFYPDTKSFFFSGKVKYKKDDLRMTTDTLQYIYSKQTTYFFGPTTILKDSTTMYCERGWYNVETEEGSLIHRARIDQQSRIIKGDTLLYQPQKGRSIGKGNVYFIDTLEKTVLKGNYGENLENEFRSWMTGNAGAALIRDKDTIYIEADTLMNQNDSLNKLLYTKAFQHARVFNTSVQARADSLFYSKSEGRMELFRQPMVWSDQSELKGDSITVLLNDSLVESVFIRENATVIMEVDSGLYYNQLAGQQILGKFIAGDLRRTDISGSAITIFYPTDQEESDSTITITRMGMNRIYASELRIYIDSGEVTGVTYFDKPDGVFYPIDQLPEKEKFIRNFSLKTDLRPKKEEFVGYFVEEGD